MTNNREKLSPFMRHVAAPALAPLAVVGLSCTPVTLLGCANRGLLALAIVGFSLVAALALAIRGLMARIRGRVVSAWWIATAAILMLPALLVIGPLG